MIYKISKFNNIRHPCSVCTDSVGQEFSQSTLRDWTPKCLGLSWGVELAEGSAIHFSVSWHWLLSKTYLPVTSPHILGFLIVSGWVPVRAHQEWQRTKQRPRPPTDLASKVTEHHFLHCQLDGAVTSPPRSKGSRNTLHFLKGNGNVWK